MSTINELFSNFSLEEILMFVILFFMATKVVGELFDYFYKKLKNYFGEKDEAEERLEAILQRLDKIEQNNNARNEELINIQARRDEQIASIQQSIAALFHRMQASDKSYILDKIHSCEAEGKISDAALQDILDRYEAYSSSGEDTFLAKKVEDVKKLARK